jgi:hypothetical protein
MYGMQFSRFSVLPAMESSSSEMGDIYKPRSVLLFPFCWLEERGGTQEEPPLTTRQNTLLHGNELFTRRRRRLVSRGFLFVCWHQLNGTSFFSFLSGKKKERE